MSSHSSKQTAKQKREMVNFIGKFRTITFDKDCEISLVFVRYDVFAIASGRRHFDLVSVPIDII